MRKFDLCGLACKLALPALGLALAAVACRQPAGIQPPAIGSGQAVAPRPTPVQTSVTDYRQPKFTVETRENIVYALANVMSADGAPGLKALRLAAYLPTGHDARDKPALVMVDAGGADNAAIAQALAARGFVVFLAAVRTAADNPPQADIAGLIDTHAAVRYVHAHARDFGVGETRVAVGGAGAAAPIALAAATTDPEANVKDPPAPSNFDQHPLHPYNSPNGLAHIRAAIVLGGAGGEALPDGPPIFFGAADPQAIGDFLVAQMVDDRTIFYRVDLVPTPQGRAWRTPGGGFYKKDQELTLKTTPAPGFRFVDWTGANKDFNETTKLPITNNLTVTPRYAPRVPAETFTLEGEIKGEGRIQLDPPGGSYPRNTWVRVYKLPAVGWEHQAVPPAITAGMNYIDVFVDRSSTIGVTFQTASGGPYALTASAEGDGQVQLDPPGGSYPAGTVVTATAVPAAGKRFAWWSGDTRQWTNKAIVVMNGNKRVTAGFQ